MREQSRRYVVKYTRIDSRAYPLLRFGLSHNQRTATVTAYVDTGAAMSIFVPGVAERLDLDYRSGRLTYVRVGDGGLIPVYLHRLPVHIGQSSFQASVGFSERLGVVGSPGQKGYHPLRHQTPDTMTQDTMIFPNASPVELTL